MFKKHLFNLLTTFTFLLIFQSNIHSMHNQIAVKPTTQISEYENWYKQQREPIRRQALLNFSNQQDHGQRLPEIAFCTSGGGYRAMIATLGFMMGTEEIGLTQATSYISALSGSTWLLGHLFVRNLFQQQNSQEDFFNWFYTKLKERVVEADFFDPTTLNIEAIKRKIIQKYGSEYLIQAIDLWGAILADRLWGDIGGDLAQNISFYNVRFLFNQNFYYPFPIFTSVCTNVFPYKWIETNPFDTRGDYIRSNVEHERNGAVIPTIAYNSIFDKGTCTQQRLEDSLGFYIGVSGSPYSLSLGDILKNILEDLHDPWLNQFINWLIEKYDLFKKRILPTQVNNFLSGMDGPLAQLQELTVTDAGMDFNLPFPPLLKAERLPQIIVVCDASSDATQRKAKYKQFQDYLENVKKLKQKQYLSPEELTSINPSSWALSENLAEIRPLQLKESKYYELEHAKLYAQRKGLKFPPLDNPQIIDEHIAIFEDQNDQNCPIIIYFANPIPEGTLHFDYTEKEFNNVCLTMKNMVTKKKTKQAIIDAINKKILSPINTEWPVPSAPPLPFATCRQLVPLAQFPQQYVMHAGPNGYARLPQNEDSDDEEEGFCSFLERLCLR